MCQPVEIKLQDTNDDAISGLITGQLQQGTDDIVDNKRIDKRSYYSAGYNSLGLSTLGHRYNSYNLGHPS